MPKGHSDKRSAEATATLEWRPVESVIPYARNPRFVSETAISKVAGSIAEFGFRQPIVVDGEGIIIVGHTRLLAAQRLGLETVPVLVAADLSPAQVKAYRIADNRTAQETTWDYELLELEVDDLGELDYDLSLTGLDDDELADLHEDGDGGSGENGALLELLDVAIDEPKHTVEPGQVWHVGRHVLLCADVMQGWREWTSHLEGDAVFVPYPGPYMALSNLAEDASTRLVMVQPDPYIAGHLLDQYAAVHGEDTIEAV